MAYTPDTNIGTMTTVDRALLNADSAEMVTEAVMRSTNVRTGTRFRSADLEHPEHDLVVNEYCGHKALQWWNGGGQGRPIVFEDDPAPEYTLNAAGQPDGSNENLWEAQNFVNTIGCLLVPRWGGFTAATPKLRLKRLSVSVIVAVNDETLQEASTSAKQFENDADVAGALTVRVHRVAYDKIRARPIAQSPITARPVPPNNVTLAAVDLVSERIEATRVGALTGMIAGPRVRSEVGTIATSGIHPKFDGSSNGAIIASSVQFRLFHAHALLGPGSLSARQNLAPGDALLVSVTGSDRLINAGEPAFNAAKRNTVLPVRGHWVVGVFRGEHAA